MKILYGLIALVFGAGFNKLAEYDHRKELDRNTQLQAADEDRQHRAFKNSKNNVIKRINALRKRLVLSLLSMGSAIGTAFITTYYEIGIQTPQKVVVISSAFFFASATLGKLGWSSRSWKGNTSVEELDNFVFHILYWFGMYLGAVSIL